MNTKSKATQKHFKQWLLPILAIVLLALTVAWLAGAFSHKIAPEVMPINPTVVIKTMPVKSSSVETFEAVPASITAKQATIISSRLLARIDEIHVRSGDKIKQGDVLITLESNDLASQVIEAQEQVNATKARNTEIKQNFQRAKELFTKEMISTFELDKSKADYQSSIAQLTAAQQNLQQAKTTLSYTTLRAPINGKVVDRFAEPGNTAQPGNKLLSLYNPLSLRVEAQVREQLAVKLIVGQSIKVILPVVDKTLTGQIEEIVPAANTGSRTFLIKVSLPYQDTMLPGMYAKLLIPAGRVTKNLIPQNAVHHVGQLSFVRVVIDNQPQRRFVRIGEVNNKRVSIISGLSEGEVIVVPAT